MILDEMLSAVEEELKRAVQQAGGNDLAELHYMLAYHMGWEGEGAGPEASGKRIRPLLVLLTCAAAGNDWHRALPAAAAVELVHNFSLIHDDIQDNSTLRRGRETVWKRWGVPQAINAGDTLFSLAQLTILRLAETASPEVSLRAAQVLHETCLQLTQGQYLDLAYESRGNLSIEAYWPMVTGKTGALLSACTRIGAIVACAPEDVIQAYARFGLSLGLAFQLQDDLLGIWGDAELTGKSAESDLISGKKSLPVLYGLERQGPFARRWSQGNIRSHEVRELAEQLKNEGAYDYTRELANQHTTRALECLEQARPSGEAGEALIGLARRLLSRKA